MKQYKMVAVLFGLSLLSACGGRWIDDTKNFERIFGFRKPEDVQVLHSYYWKSSHWTTEYSYFIALQPSKEFLAGLTSAKLMRETAPSETAVSSCGDQCPAWFLPKPIEAYKMWVPNAGEGYRVFRDRAEGIVFVCDTHL